MGIRYKHYFDDFFSELPPKVQEKIDYSLYIVQYLQRVPEKFLKHIEAVKGLYEIRTEIGSNISNILFFDEGRLVVLMNGFQKKTQKTPKGEIELAERLMKNYFEEKDLKKN